MTLSDIQLMSNKEVNTGNIYANFQVETGSNLVGELGDLSLQDQYFTKR